MLRSNIKQLIRFQQAKQSGLSFRYTRPIFQSSLASKTRALGTTAEPTATAPAVSAFQELLGVGSQPVREDLTNTFYQRQLPTNLVRFSSSEGKRYFREAMDDGRAEGFFPLTGNFTTQSEPAYCGPSSLAMVLNALEVDPKRRWKGNWRWFSDEFLQCCSSKEDMKKNGITFDNFACLAKCHCNVQVKRARDFTLEEFRKDVLQVTSTSEQFMVLSFSRKVLGQTGDGHFSPIGAYNSANDSILILDTARYKYPSYWCDLSTVFESMQPIDKETGRPRGYFLLSYDADHPPVSLCSVKPEARAKNDDAAQMNNDISPGKTIISKSEAEKSSKLNWSTLAKSFCQRIPENMWIEKPRTLEHVIQLVLRNVPSEYTKILANQSLASFNADTPAKAEEYINTLLKDTTKTPLYPIVMESMYPDRGNFTQMDGNAVFATLFVLGSPRMLYTSLPRELQDLLDKFRKGDEMTPLVKGEVNRISEEVTELTKTFCTCGPASTEKIDAKKNCSSV